MKRIYMLIAAVILTVGMVNAQAQRWNFSSSEFDAHVGDIESTITVEGLTIVGTADSPVSIDDNNKTVDGVDYTRRLKSNGSGGFDDETTPAKRVYSFEVDGNCDISIVLTSANSSEDRELVVAAGGESNELERLTARMDGPTKETISYEGAATTIYLWSSNSGVNLYDIEVTPTGGNKIVFLEADDREPEQIKFLEENGFDVTVMGEFNLSEVSEDSDTIQTLNEADLVIIGRSPNSGFYRGADAEAWNEITAPVILNAQYVASNGTERINWFSESSAFHADEEPELAHITVDPDNEIFSAHVDVSADNTIPWMYAPHDFLAIGDGATNGAVAAEFAEDTVVVVQYEAGSPLYTTVDGEGPSPAGARTYFGFGNDNLDWDNFFPLTEEAQQVYLNEINRLTNNPMTEAVTVPRTLPPASVVFSESDEREPQQREFLEAQGYEVTVMESFLLSELTEDSDTIDILNDADLVIIGRSPGSGDYRGEDAEAWNEITTPVILNGQYVAAGGPERINWFADSEAFHANEEPELAHITVDPNNEIFSEYVDVSADNTIPWMYAPHDLLAIGEGATNGAVAAEFAEDTVVVVQYEAGSPVYDGGPSPAGARTYFGFGNDNLDWDNFFPLTEEAQQVYFNEMQRLMGREMEEVSPVNRTMAPLSVVFIESEERDSVQREFLEANGIELTVLESFKLSTLTAETDTVDMLNDADIVIIGRSPNSGDFQGEDAEAWMNITSPVVLNAQYVAHSGTERINWFSESGAFHANTDPNVAYARVAEPSSELYTFVDVLEGDSIPWMHAPHDMLSIGEDATNGEIAATFQGQDSAVLITISEAETPLYTDGPTPLGDRVYFGFGNDNAGWDNFFPLTDEAQQVYLNVLHLLTDRPLKEAVTVNRTTEPTSVAPVAEDEDPGFDVIASKGSVTVTVDEGTEKVAIYSLSGQIVDMVNVSGSRTVNLDSGLYIVRVGNLGVAKVMIAE